MGFVWSAPRERLRRPGLREAWGTGARPPTPRRGLARGAGSEELEQQPPGVRDPWEDGSKNPGTTHPGRPLLDGNITGDPPSLRDSEPPFSRARK